MDNQNNVHPLNVHFKEIKLCTENELESKTLKVYWEYISISVKQDFESLLKVRRISSNTRRALDQSKYNPLISSLL